MIWVRGVEYGTASALADRFGVTVWTVYKWRKRHGLTTTRIRGRDYSPALEAAAVELATRDATRGAPRLDTVGAGA